jgi:hypothetical protein
MPKEELHNLYPSPDIIRIISIRGREGKCINKGLVGKPEGRTPPERLKHRFVDNIKMDIIIYGVGA